MNTILLLCLLAFELMGSIVGKLSDYDNDESIFNSPLCFDDKSEQRRRVFKQEINFKTFSLKLSLSK